MTTSDVNEQQRFGVIDFLISRKKDKGKNFTLNLNSGVKIYVDVGKNLVRRILGNNANENKTTISIRTYSGVSFLIIILPLWFDIKSNYIIITENNILVARSNLWLGLRKKKTHNFAIADIEMMALDWPTFFSGFNGKLHIQLKNGGGVLSIPIQPKAAKALERLLEPEV